MATPEQATTTCAARHSNATYVQTVAAIAYNCINSKNMNRNSKTFKITMGGICLALAVVFIFLATIVPGIELTLFAISSLFTVIMIMETGSRDGNRHSLGGAVLLYVGASILGLILIPNKLALIPYIAIFGYYPILKYCIEKIKSGILQITLKVIYFAAILSFGLLAFKTVIAQSISFPDYPVAVLIIAGTALMIFYDYILSFLINWYIRRFRTGDESVFKLS
ncbi:MAG: hypothetical protein PHS19_01250 [Eubacteriales bacterium]|nr:hypothetical protein [Eubacteriales bacterium]